MRYFDLFESFGNVIDFNPNGGDETLFRLDLKAHNGTITDQEIKTFGSFLNSHKMDFIRLYHGTSSRHDVMGSGLLATSSGRARSLQSAPGYVYLAYDPESALSFARMGYAGDDADLIVYAVDVTVRRLLPDHDQLRNKRQYAGMDVGATLTHSLIYGRGARVKGRIEPNQVHIWGRFNRQGERLNESVQSSGRSVDEILYHGSANEFDAFDPGHSNGWSNPRPGFYFTDDEEVVREFFGEPKKWRVRLRNAADFEHGGGSDLVKRVVAAQPSLQSALENVRTAYGSDGEDDRLATRFAARGYLQRDDFVGTLAKMGFDGMIFDDLMSQTPFTSYVAFNAGSASRA